MRSWAAAPLERKWMMLALALVLAGVLSAVALIVSSRPAPADDSANGAQVPASISGQVADPVKASVSLSGRPNLDRAATDQIAGSADDARRVATALAATVPLPEGGNFNGVAWQNAVGMPRDQIESVLEYNAMCQWVRAVADGRQTSDAKQVLAQVPAWPTFRGADDHEFVVGLATDREAFQRRLPECVGSLNMERANAEKQALVPTS